MAAASSSSCRAPCRQQVGTSCQYIDPHLAHSVPWVMQGALRLQAVQEADLAASSRCNRCTAGVLLCTTHFMYCTHSAFLQKTAGRLALPHALPPATAAVAACRRCAALSPPIVVQAEPCSTAPVEDTRGTEPLNHAKHSCRMCPKLQKSSTGGRTTHRTAAVTLADAGSREGPVTACRRRTLPARGTARTAGRSAAGCRPSAASPA